MMRSWKRHLVAAGLTAVVLTWLRGGYRDFPLVVLVFGAAGYVASVVFGALLAPRSFSRIDAALGRSVPASVVRNSLALGFILATLVWAGSVIISGGFAGWLVFLLTSLLVPLVVCVLATRWSIAAGIVASTCILLSLWTTHLGSRYRPPGEVWEGWQLYAVAWLVAVGLSLIWSIPIHMRRRAA